jgi:hypothetical protein
MKQEPGRHGRLAKAAEDLASARTLIDTVHPANALLFMAITNHERVGKALEHLNAGLQPFVERELKSTYKDK